MQNYTAGNPASVLYIKNLAKDVVPEDFYFIFGETKWIHSYFTQIVTSEHSVPMIKWEKKIIVTL